MNSTYIDITPSPRLLQVLGDIPLAPWQCVAEFVDNSLDELVRGKNQVFKEKLKIEINTQSDSNRSLLLIIKDNGLGMSEQELRTALRAGATSKARYGTLGLFGMGFNIATARLGSSTTVTTSRHGDEESLSATIDFQELQRTEKFIAPLTKINKKNQTASGTEIRIKLKREMATYFAAKDNLRTLRQQLGDIYSFLLRNQVPGINRQNLSSKVQAEIFVEGERVEPKIPCIWSDSRTVQSYGCAVNAVQYVDTELTEATACLSCGYWDRTNGPTSCEECGSTKLELRSRKVWGWIGIQRFIDSSRFGLDFLRFGRKILKQDKSIFKYLDQDTLQEDIEYPIEMPANRGRIVGEIHLDHVPVTYQKSDFDRQHRDWQKAIEIIRGNLPLKPRANGGINDSPLAKIFSAYRRNDPGLRYLTPGDGERAIHSAAESWANYFDKGVPRFQTDEEWYSAAKNHEEKKRGSSKPLGDGSDEVAQESVSISPTPSVFDKLIGPTKETSDTPKNPPNPSVKKVVRSRDEILEAARAFSSERTELSGEYILPLNLGTWQISVFETNQTLVCPDGNQVPCTIGSIAGGNLEILVNREHPIFSEYGRDIRDIALFQAAEVIKSLKKDVLPAPAIYGLLVEKLSDFRLTANALQEQADNLINRIQVLIFEMIQDDPERWWGHVPGFDKTTIEEKAAVRFPNKSFDKIISDGNFILLANGRTLAGLIEFSPLSFFDNKVFRAALDNRPEAGRKRIVQKVVDHLRGLSDFAEDPLARQIDDLGLAKLRIEIIARQIRSDSQL